MMIFPCIYHWENGYLSGTDTRTFIGFQNFKEKIEYSF